MRACVHTTIGKTLSVKCCGAIFFSIARRQEQQGEEGGKDENLDPKWHDKTNRLTDTECNAGQSGICSDDARSLNSQFSYDTTSWSARKMCNPRPRTESASLWRIQQILSHHLEAWCVLLDSLIKRTRNISTHASPKAYLLRSGLAHTLGNACYVYRRCSHTTLSNFTGPYSHVTIIRCVRSRISGSFPLHYSHSLLLLTMFVKKFKD